MSVDGGNMRRAMLQECPADIIVVLPTKVFIVVKYRDLRVVEVVVNLRNTTKHLCQASGLPTTAMTPGVIISPSQWKVRAQLGPRSFAGVSTASVSAMHGVRMPAAAVVAISH